SELSPTLSWLHGVKPGVGQVLLETISAVTGANVLSPLITLESGHTWWMDRDEPAFYLTVGHDVAEDLYDGATWVSALQKNSTVLVVFRRTDSELNAHGVEFQGRKFVDTSLLADQSGAGVFLA